MNFLIQPNATRRIISPGEPIAFHGLSDPVLRISTHIIQPAGNEYAITFNEDVTLTGDITQALSYKADMIPVAVLGGGILGGNLLGGTLDSQIQEGMYVTASFDDTLATLTGDTTGTIIESFNDVPVQNFSTVTPTAQVYYVSDGAGGWQVASDGAAEPLFVSV